MKLRRQKIQPVTVDLADIFRRGTDIRVDHTVTHKYEAKPQPRLVNLQILNAAGVPVAAEYIGTLDHGWRKSFDLRNILQYGAQDEHETFMLELRWQT